MFLLPEGDGQRCPDCARGRSEGQSPDDALPRRSLDSVLPLPGTDLCDACCSCHPGAAAGSVVPAIVHAGVLIPRPRPTGGETTAKRVTAVADGRSSPCCTPLNSCNIPVARAGPPVPVPIHTGVIVRVPHPSGGRAAAGCVATIAGALSPSCPAPIDSCCCSPRGIYAVSPVPILTHYGVVVRRSSPTDGRTAAGCVAAVDGGRTP